MATWVTHLMIADKILKNLPNLDRRGFCVGNIAPDCNIENEDWTSFTPSREVTHWMQGEKKSIENADLFCDEYIIKRRDNIKSDEEYSFLLGYYSHLLTDAAFSDMIRNEERIRAVWRRIKEDEELRNMSFYTEETWDSAKKLISKKRMMKEIYSIEEEYIQCHPESGYLTEILTLTDFPDYIDYLPHGCIVRKIRAMGYLPDIGCAVKNIAFSRKEYAEFISNTTQLVLNKFKEKL